MVLKILAFTFFTFGFQFSIFAQLELVFTDNFDANYFSSEDVTETQLHFGSNLFQFVKNEDLNICGAYIDSFLKTENVQFYENVSFNNQNELIFTLKNINAKGCEKLSSIWHLNYNISWLKLLNSLIETNNSIDYNPEKKILKGLYLHEQSRTYHTANVVNNSLLAFVLPSKLIYDDFNNSKLSSTKRYSSLESIKDYTEISYDSHLKSNQIKYLIPTFNKKTFLKNTVGLYVLKELVANEYKIDIKYSISQAFASFKIKLDSINIDSFKLNFNENNLNIADFTSKKNKAIQAVIKSITEDNLFFYSYNDLVRLHKFYKTYTIKDLEKEIELLNQKQFYTILVSETNPFEYFGKKIEKLDIKTFQKELLFKANSIKFSNSKDSLLLDKLSLFLDLNPKLKLNIISFSKKNEYLYVEKTKKDAIINKYIEAGYIISKTQKLKLYRSLYIFDEITKRGIEPSRMMCIGRSSKFAKVNFEFFRKD